VCAVPAPSPKPKKTAGAGGQAAAVARSVAACAFRPEVHALGGLRWEGAQIRFSGTSLGDRHPLRCPRRSPARFPTGQPPSHRQDQAHVLGPVDPGLCSAEQAAEQWVDQSGSGQAQSAGRDTARRLDASSALGQCSPRLNLVSTWPFLSRIMSVRPIRSVTGSFLRPRCNPRPKKSGTDLFFVSSPVHQWSSRIVRVRCSWEDTLV